MSLCRKLFTNFIAFLCLVLHVSAAGDTLLAEEGWRYQGTFAATLQYQGQKFDVDFFSEHESMAHLIRADADSGQYSSMLRFTPVFFDGSALTVGPTVCLKPIECLQSPLPSYEVAFASGTYC
jgi:hypothetical protein